LPIALGPIYCQQGRLEETLRLIEARWDALNRAGEGDSESAINLIRGHIERRRSPIPVEVIRSDLDPAAQLNPQDDRVWLGKANLAIRVRSYQEAERWLDACLRRRPEDVPVWRARLEWAVATNRVVEAREAMKHLPVEESTPAQVWTLAAWLAAKRGDLASERRALERLIAVDPTDSAAFDRLAEMAVQEGQPARADEFRQRKAEIDRLEARYQKLYQRNQPARDAEEMAQLAEQLGRRFEARAFLTVAIMDDSDRDDLRRHLDRLKQDARTIEEPGRTLADLLVADLDGSASDQARSSRPWPRLVEDRDHQRQVNRPERKPSREN
jgi:tetratricopeptide (TPR) repeat protein